jgi:hypothetical protein
MQSFGDFLTGFRPASTGEVQPTNSGAVFFRPRRIGSKCDARGFTDSLPCLCLLFVVRGVPRRPASVSTRTVSDLCGAEEHERYPCHGSKAEKQPPALADPVPVQPDTHGAAEGREQRDSPAGWNARELGTSCGSAGP